jgi:TM2 domain-containing membrane protein YozV
VIEPVEPPEPPDPVMAACWSFLIPGAGQIYVGQKRKGAVLIAVALLTCFGLGVWNILASIDAYRVANRVLRGEALRPWQCF